MRNRNRATYKCSCYAHRGFTPYKNNAHTSHMVCAAPGRGRGGVLALLAIFTVKTKTEDAGPRVFARFFKCMDTPFRVPFRFATYKYMLSCACVIPSPSPLFSATTEHTVAPARAPGPRGRGREPGYQRRQRAISRTYNWRRVQAQHALCGKQAAPRRVAAVPSSERPGLGSAASPNRRRGTRALGRGYLCPRLTRARWRA